jgi:serine/threonine protein kinase
VKISHPNIVNAVDFYLEFGDTGCQMNLVMDYCDGGDLSSLLKKQKNEPIPTEIVKNIIFQLVDAIKFIHSKNIIHRDLKPGKPPTSHEQYLGNIFIMKVFNFLLTQSRILTM